MALLIPAVLESEVEAITPLLSQLKEGTQRLHIDFADGSLIPVQTIMPEAWRDYRDQLTGYELEAHLMVDRPSQYFATLAQLGFQRVILHIESAEIHDNFEVVKMSLADHHLSFAMTLNPESPIEGFAGYAPGADYLQLMGVNPGYGGQSLIESTYDRIELTKSQFSNPIAIDGGVRSTNQEQLIESGAELLVVGKGGWRELGL